MRPVSSHSSPSRRAVVVMLWELVPASGSVIAKAIVPGAVGDARAASAASAPRCRSGDDRAADRRADDHHQQRAALRGELLADRRDVADAAAPAAVLLGDVDAEVAVLADLQPQLGGLPAAAGLLGEVVAAVLRRQLGDLLAQLLALLGLGEALMLVSFLAPPRPGPRPPRPVAGLTSISVTMPASGAVTVCCIFIASSTSTVWPALDLGALLDGDADHGAGHRRQQAAARHRVGRVGEPRHPCQPRHAASDRRRRPRPRRWRPRTSCACRRPRASRSSRSPSRTSRPSTE